MSYSVSEESLDWLHRYWQEHPAELVWEPLFILPPWLKVWQRNFAPGENAISLCVEEDRQVIGIVPLLIKKDGAKIIGSANVCDYVDIVTAPGKEEAVSRALLDYLVSKNIRTFESGTVRSDSKISGSLSEIARNAVWDVTTVPDEVSLEKELPASWEAYLQTLDTKQRHEVRRKMRRLEEAGKVNYRIISDSATVPAFMSTFLKMFTESREDKALFLTPQMTAYFNDIAFAMAEIGVLRNGILELDGTPVASVLAFDYNGTVYLYNSGFDVTRNNLSVGILSKALLIKDSIERGKNKFDFLKGNEHYKYHLGGKEVRLLNYRMVLHE